MYLVPSNVNESLYFLGLSRLKLNNCMINRLFFLVIILCIVPKSLLAQDSLNLRLGGISSQDFMVNLPFEDPNTGALILADIGSTELEGYEYGFRIEFKRLRRIRILNSKGFDATTVVLRFSGEDNGRKKLKSLKAVTYNLEGAKIVHTKLNEKDFFLDNSDRDDVEEKFTFPNVKVGSIIEYEYIIKSSSYFQLHPWSFQGKYPRMLSMYTVKIPDIFNYVFLTQGNLPVTRNAEVSGEQVLVAGRTGYFTHIHTTTWVMREVPPLKEEPFTSTLENYIAQIKFQLSLRPINSTHSETILRDWQFAANRLLGDDRFGIPLSKNNKKLNQDIDQIVTGCNSALSKAKRIFAFVRDNFKANGGGIYMTPAVDLIDVFNKRAGNVADVNLLLIAMLKYENIVADPVILSTRNNGLTNMTYPIMENFNYVICKVLIDDNTYYLDASNPRIGFGKLPLDCYNGPARAITRNTYPVLLQPDSLLEAKMTTVFIFNDSKNKMTATCESYPGYFESLGIRSTLATTVPEDFFKDISKAFTLEATLESAGIDSLQQYDGPLRIHYNMRFSPGDGDILYFNPMTNEARKENPFRSALRSYPVEMPYAIDETYILNMEIPQGYKVDDLPKSAKAKLNDDDGLYEYMIANNLDHIQLKSRIILKKAIFQPEEYQSLRDFFAFIVKKQSEMITFKKTN
jgi:hypothetical protein